MDSPITAAELKRSPVCRSTVPSEGQSPVASVSDVFCGAGALSHGFLSEGFSVACGVDIEPACRFPFEANNKAPFLQQDITQLDADEISQAFLPNVPRVLIGCAPCQPFSQYAQGRNCAKWTLLDYFAKLAVSIRPDVVSMENVPQLARFKGGRVFQDFVDKLESAGYCVRWTVADCRDFGVPQARLRLVLVASLHGRPSLPQPTHPQEGHRTVRDAIEYMPPIEAGEVFDCDPLHRTSALSDLNVRRIQASRPGGSWRDWKGDLISECHKKETGQGYSGVYGRMEWDQSSPTITTQFYGFGNGRFGHPVQDRAISIREGALLQSFPTDYAFESPEEPLSIKMLGVLIGNAVPVLMARAIARAVRGHLDYAMDTA